MTDQPDPAPAGALAADEYEGRKSRIGDHLAAHLGVSDPAERWAITCALTEIGQYAAEVAYQRSRECAEKAERERDDLLAALSELVAVADLRGDADLPHPSDDPKLWTARMQAAWDDARALIARMEGNDAQAKSE